MVNIPNLDLYTRRLRRFLRTPMLDSQKYKFEELPLILQLDLLGLTENKGPEPLQNSHIAREVHVHAGAPEQGVVVLLITPMGSITLRDIAAVTCFKNSMVVKPQVVKGRQSQLLLLPREIVGDLSGGFYGLRFEFYVRGQDPTGVYSHGGEPPTFESMMKNQAPVRFEDLTAEFRPDPEGTGRIARVDQENPQSPAGILYVSCFQ